jgi:hypothetical protein
MTDAVDYPVVARVWCLYPDHWLKWDYVFGLRAWGLVVYGTIPSTLSALGVIKVSAFSGRSIGLLLPLLILAVIPIFTVYLLIRQRLGSWYLTKDLLAVRSISLTFCILVCSSIVSWALGLINGRYQFRSLSELRMTDADLIWLPLIESVLLGVVSLVVSSTLFITAIKESGGLPGLPSQEFVKDIATLKDSLKALSRDPIWHKREFTKALDMNLETAEDVASRLAEHVSQYPWQRKFYRDFASDVSALRTVLSQLELTMVKWPDFHLNQYDRALRHATMKVRGLLNNA